MIPNGDVVEIDEDETERVLAVAAAVDVAKASGMVCVRRPHPSIEGRRTSRVWGVESTTNSILTLGADLVALGYELRSDHRGILHGSVASGLRPDP